MANFIEPHNADWKIEFSVLRSALQNILRDYSVDIQHVGSTAVKDLCAKPILDIDIIIDNKNDLNKMTSELEKVGYQPIGEQGISGRFSLKQKSNRTPITNDTKKWQEHHLYVCLSDSLALKNHLLFRDALLNDNKLVAQYAQLKLDLMKEEGMTREIYCKRKTEFIISILSKHGFGKEELDKVIRENS